MLHWAATQAEGIGATGATVGHNQGRGLVAATPGNPMCSVYSRPLWQGFSVAKMGTIAGVTGRQKRQEESRYSGRQKVSHFDAPDLDHPRELRTAARSCDEIDGCLSQEISLEGGKHCLRMACEIKDRNRTSVTASSGLAQVEVTLIFCVRPIYRWQHRLTQRNPTGTELKGRLEKQCEWKRGSEILRSKIMATVERTPSGGPEPTMRPPLTCNFRDIRPLIGVAEMACGSKESNPLYLS